MAQFAIEDQRERKIQVNRLELIEKLTANREKHGREYREALLGYKQMATEKLKEGYASAKKRLDANYQDGVARIDRFNPDNPEEYGDNLRLIEAFSIALKVPRNFTDKYDAAIDMAKWDVRETLELSYAEFQCFVRDVWEWSNEFKHVTMMYNSKAR